MKGEIRALKECLKTTKWEKENLEQFIVKQCRCFQPALLEIMGVGEIRQNEEGVYTYPCPSDRYPATMETKEGPSHECVHEWSFLDISTPPIHYV